MNYIELLEPLIKIAALIGGLMTAAAYFVLLERRMAAWVQDRIGPNRVGIPLTKIRLFGLGQPMADGVKFILKEEYTPAHVDKRLYILAPITILVAALAVFAVIPFGSVTPAIPGLERPVQLIVAPGVDVGMIYVFALSSIAVYGVVLGGWASNNKYSFLGGLRSSAQLIAYELPMGLGLLGVTLAAGSLDLDVIIQKQAETGMWNAIAQPLGFIVFVIAAFAEAARLPFDLPECEQELVGGYHTEYSGIKLLLFLVAEFLHMITASFLIVILFLGGWHCWGITGSSADVGWVGALLRIGILTAKIVGVILFFMLTRWSWPRFRFDQLMALAWKIMLPLGIANLVVVAVLYELRAALDPENQSALIWDLVMLGPTWLTCIVGWLVVAYTGALVTDNTPRRDLSPGIDDALSG
ncbi:MAG: NADH-quinone oxidoreductase subunit NuoH [Planctomycetota bacterium]